MITHPTAAELARAIAQWLAEVRSQLDQRNAFLARVAINALGVIDRELTQGGAAEAATISQLALILGHSGDYATLTRELCERIRNGSLESTPELLAILRDDTAAKLAIDQPNYRHERSP